VPFEGIGFHVGIIVAPFRQRHAMSPFLLAGLTALSQIAVASGYLQQAVATAVGDGPGSGHSGPNAPTAPPNPRY
jgi:hypothetical protein